MLGALIVAAAAVLTTSPASADDNYPYLLGSLGNVRPSLGDRGINFELVLTTDTWKVLRGGTRRGTEVMNNLDFTIEMDTEGAGLWRNGTAFVYLIGDFGGAATSNVGDLQSTSNIEARSTAKVFEAWYQHEFMEGTASVLFGLHDLNSEFDVLEYAGTLVNGSFGMGPDLSQVGPSTFPTSALGVRLNWDLTDSWYLRVAGYDGVPGDPDRDRGTHVQIRHHKDGFLWAGEAGRVTGDPEADYSKLALGFWYKDSDFVDFTGTSRSFTNGIYMLAERSLLREADPSQGLGGFLRVGFTHGDRYEIDRYIGSGLTYVGLVPGRDEDVASIGVAYASAGGAYIRNNPADYHAETAAELTYKAQVIPGLAVQPDLQLVYHPSFQRTRRGTAIVGGVRVEMSF